MRYDDDEFELADDDVFGGDDDDGDLLLGDGIDQGGVGDDDNWE